MGPIRGCFLGLPIPTQAPPFADIFVTALLLAVSVMSCTGLLCRSIRLYGVWAGIGAARNIFVNVNTDLKKSIASQRLSVTMFLQTRFEYLRLVMQIFCREGSRSLNLKLPPPCCVYMAKPDMKPFTYIHIKSIQQSIIGKFQPLMLHCCDLFRSFHQILM